MHEEFLRSMHKIHKNEYAFFFFNVQTHHEVEPNNPSYMVDLENCKSFRSVG